MTLEQAILEKLRSLPPDKQQEVLDFADLLAQESQSTVRSTAINWRDDPCIGMWKDREDMQNSTAWVHQIRQQDWSR